MPHVPNQAFCNFDGVDKGCSLLKSIGTVPIRDRFRSDLLKGVEKIGDHAFFKCSSLSSVTLGPAVKTIGVGAFAHCPSLTSVTMGSSVEHIGQGAFAYCRSLKAITIPASASVHTAAFFDSTTVVTKLTPEQMVAAEVCVAPAHVLAFAAAPPRLQPRILVWFGSYNPPFDHLLRLLCVPFIGSP